MQIALPAYCGPSVTETLAFVQRQKGPPKTLADFARTQGFEPAAHHQIICDALDKCATEGSQRIMIFLPPGSAKSTYASILFPAEFVAKFPKKKIIAACHTADLADYFGGEVRAIVNSSAFKVIYPNVTIEKGNAARSEWKTTNGSSYKSAGIGGPLSGRRADLLLIDDPVKDDEAASSPVQRAKVLEWYKKVARTRLKPGGSIIIIQTRWHEEDLGGALLELYQGWQQITIRMECEDENDPLGRKIGERLWPEYFTELDIKEAKVDPRTWISLYQQRPTPMEGSFFQIGKLETVHGSKIPLTPKYCSHDTAATEGGGDWSAFACCNRDAEGIVYMDVSRFQYEPGKRNKRFLRMAKAMQPVKYRIPEEIGIGGKENAENFKRQCVKEGIHGAYTQKISGDKSVRAENFAAAVNSGIVRIVESQHSYDCIEEMRQFPNGKHDDCVDAMADAYNAMILHEVAEIRATRTTKIGDEDEDE